ncbi:MULTISPECIES: hypothetical protein [Thermocrispum]|jgi:hypothetical protein|uniref:Uncharacterized protein n=1 Tax=Thermocrispum agreste TaxID=37925 RepID=A0ABD6FMF8_9PSEU|nr:MULTISPECIES: hypothetical protein [Thermocrispum]
MECIDNIIRAAYSALIDFEKRAEVNREAMVAVGNAVRFLVADLESAKGLIKV